VLGAINMTLKLLVTFMLTLGCVVIALAYSTTTSFDGTNPPHAVDTDGKTIPESSATQPAKPIILSKDIHDDKYGEMKPEAAFDHSKHNTDVMHTLDGKTLTNCVYCHHTEQPSASGGETYLKTFKRTAVLTAAQLDSSKEPVKSCRACHFQKSTPATDEFPPKSVTYPREVAKRLGTRESGDLTNDNAYHIRCISCHDAATKRDATLKAPTGCPDCHIKKTAASTGTTTPTPSTTPGTASTPAVASTPTMESTPTVTSTPAMESTPTMTPTSSPTP